MSTLLKTYLLVFHLLLLLFFVRSDLFQRLSGSGNNGRPPHYENSVAFHERALGHAADGFVAVLGDSHVQGLAVSRLGGNVVNLGIGGDTTEGVRARIGRYPDLRRAGLVVLAVGLNDLRHAQPEEVADSYGALLTDLLQAVPGRLILCSAVLPVSGEAAGRSNYAPRIRALNLAIEEQCQRDSRAHFISAFDRLSDERGELRSEFDLGDGVHLSTAGYEEWLVSLIPAVRKGRRDVVR